MALRARPARPPEERTHTERLASRDGYFAPESVIRRVGNTPVTPFLGGGSAVLLQVAGTPYSASDPELMLWVHATLVQASLSSYQRFQQPLWPEEQERYYQEMAVVARLFGTPAAVIPRTLADFRDYFRGEIDSNTIAVTPIAQEIAEVILRAPLPVPLQMLAPAHRLATTAQLPPRLRREYGLRWTPLHALLLPVAARSVRLIAWPMLLAAARLRPPPAAVAA
jgi:uncharacterized protein (DUF2236 family)